MQTARNWPGRAWTGVFLSTCCFERNLPSGKVNRRLIPAGTTLGGRRERLPDRGNCAAGIQVCFQAFRIGTGQGLDNRPSESLPFRGPSRQGRPAARGLEIDGDAALFPITIANGIRPLAAVYFDRNIPGLNGGMPAPFFRLPKRTLRSFRKTGFHPGSGGGCIAIVTRPGCLAFAFHGFPSLMFPII